MPVVKFFVRLDLEQICRFLDRHEFVFMPERDSGGEVGRDRLSDNGAYVVGLPTTFEFGATFSIRTLTMLFTGWRLPGMVTGI